MLNFISNIFYPLHFPVLILTPNISEEDEEIKRRAKAVDDAHRKLKKAAKETVQAASSISKKLEGRMTDLQAKLSTILASVADSVIITDEEGIILDYNMSCEELFKSKGECLTGKNITELIPGVCFEPNCKRCCHSSSSNLDGTKTPIDVTINHIENEFVYIIRDKESFA
jgi:PAS domain-containing protein